MAKLVTLSPEGSKRIRIFDISSSGRQQRECTPSEMIANLREPTELYAEVSGFGGGLAGIATVLTKTLFLFTGNPT